MEFVSTVLPIIIYVLGSILLIVLIVLGVKMIKTLDRMDKVVDSVEKKMNSLNGLFSVVDFLTDAMADISDKLVDGVGSLISKIFTRKRKNKKEREEIGEEDEQEG